MATNKIHAHKHTQAQLPSIGNDLFAPLNDEQQAAISGGYQLQERPIRTRNRDLVEVYKVERTTNPEKKCILAGIC